MDATWVAFEAHGPAPKRSGLPNSVFAFPDRRKESLTDARHVRAAVVRFNQVIDVSDSDRALAFANIQKAARYFDVRLSVTTWTELAPHSRGRPHG